MMHEYHNNISTFESQYESYEAALRELNGLMAKLDRIYKTHEIMNLEFTRGVDTVYMSAVIWVDKTQEKG